MKPRTRRTLFVLSGLMSLGVATALILQAFESNLVFFFSPSQIAAKEAPQDRLFRVGGLVKEGSVERDPAGLSVRLMVTDTVEQVQVSYVGLLPDLFQEGKGVVAQGRLDDKGVFYAQQVLAKHDENYMPPEAAEALSKAGESGSSTNRTLQKGPSL